MSNSAVDCFVYLRHAFQPLQLIPKELLVELLYLADWRSALEKGNQVSDIVWRLNFNGIDCHPIDEAARLPYSPIGIVRASQLVPERRREFGDAEVVVLSDHVPDIGLLSIDGVIELDFALDQFGQLGAHEFINLVYSTYPVLKAVPLQELDLVSFAREYRGVRGNLRRHIPPKTREPGRVTAYGVLAD